jgi:geranylgeranyl pyrophosphate synthase
MSPASATASLVEMKAEVEACLERLLEGESRLYQALRYAVLPGGKRFRPLLLLSAGEAFGGHRATLLPYACAVELVHSYSLVHDDLPCMDDDAVRRGRPSCHKAFGEARALLAGDGLLTLAFEVLAGAPTWAAGAGHKDRAVRTIAEAAGVKGMIAGQWMDIEYDPALADEASILELMALKTGALILASVRAGAIMGGAQDADLPHVDRYGRGVGLAFQLRDDLLDAGNRAEGKAGTRPNAVALFGSEGAKARLRRAVGEALDALDVSGVRSVELRSLASGLDDID